MRYEPRRILNLSLQLISYQVLNITEIKCVFNCLKLTLQRWGPFAQFVKSFRKKVDTLLAWSIQTRDQQRKVLV